MPARPVTEAVQQAAEALDHGDYRLAAETCQRVLGQFPEFATAHRLLGEALLRQGDAAGAERAFAETLRREPQSAPAYAGLGSLSERRGDGDAALAYYQVAWENAPNDTALRDQVVRLSERAYGPGGSLQLTHAALATLHARAGRWSRAVAECQAVLADHADRVDVQLRLSEALWRRGSDAEARAACQSVLDSRPLAVMALLIQADLERRGGNRDKAAELIQRAHAIDLDGVMAADLISVAPGDAASFFLPKETPLLREEVVAPERPRIAPAPDFMNPPSAKRPAVEEPPQPVAPPSNPSHSMAGSPFELGLMSQEEVDAARPGGKAFDAFDEVFKSIEGAGVAPFSFGEEGEAPAFAPFSFDQPAQPFAPPEPAPFSFDDLQFDQPQAAQTPAPTQPAPATRPAPEDDDLAALFTLASDDDIKAALPAEERPTGFTSLLNALDTLGLEPFGEEPGAAPASQATPQPPAQSQPAAAAPQPAAPPPAAEPFALSWDAIDEEIARATPAAPERGYTDELREPQAHGLEPFSTETPADEPDWLAGLTQLEQEPPAAAAPAQPAAAAPQPEPQPEPRPEPELDIAALLGNWGVADADLERAVPGETPPGFTMELQGLEQAGFEPFSYGAPEPPSLPIAEQAAAPAALEPPPPSQPVETSQPEPFEDLLFEQPAQAAGAPDVASAPMPAPAPAPAPAVVPEPVAAVAESIGQGISNLRAAIQRVGVGAELVERVRAAKERLMTEGKISGNLPLGGAPEAPSLDDLEVAVAANPADVVNRLAFASALVGTGDTRRALEQYRWLYGHPSGNDDDAQRLIGSLEELAQAGGVTGAGAHRLLGALYRRAGQLPRSAAHYQSALELQLHASAGRG